MPSGRNNKEIDNRLELVEKENRKLNSIVDSILAGATPPEISNSTPQSTQSRSQPQCYPGVANQTQRLSLKPYLLNNISFNVIPESLNIEDVFASIVDEVIVVSDDTSGFYVPSLGVNTIGEIDLTRSLNIFVRPPEGSLIEPPALYNCEQHDNNQNACNNSVDEFGISYGCYYDSNEDDCYCNYLSDSCCGDMGGGGVDVRDCNPTVQMPNISLEVFGCPIDINTVTTELYPYMLNLVPYNGNVPLFPIEDFLESVSVLLASDDNQGFYVPEFGISSINPQPGKGMRVFIEGGNTINFLPPSETMDEGLFLQTEINPAEDPFLLELDETCYSDYTTYLNAGPVNWGYGLGSSFCMDYEDWPLIWQNFYEGDGLINPFFNWRLAGFQTNYTGWDPSSPSNPIDARYGLYCVAYNTTENRVMEIPESIDPTTGLSECVTGQGEGLACPNSAGVCVKINDGPISPDTSFGQTVAPSCRRLFAKLAWQSSTAPTGSPAWLNGQDIATFMCDPSPVGDRTWDIGSFVNTSMMCAETCNFLASLPTPITAGLPIGSEGEGYSFKNCIERNLLSPLDILGNRISNGFGSNAAYTTPDNSLPCDCTGHRYLYDDGSGNLICGYRPEINLEDEEGPFVPVPEVEGCTYPQAPNYNPDATIDDGSCRFNFTPDEDIIDDPIIIDPITPTIFGCQDRNACNYNPFATMSNPRLCEYPRPCPDGVTFICPPEICSETIDPTEIDPVQDLPELIQIDNITVNDRDVTFNVNIIDYDDYNDRNQNLNVNWGDGDFAQSFDNETGPGPFTFSHTYSNYGDYFITLTLTNDGQQINDSVVFQVNITEFLPDTTDTIVVRSALIRDNRVDLTYEYLDFNVGETERNIPIKVNWGGFPDTSDIIDTPVNTPTLVTHFYDNYTNYTINISSNLNPDINTSWNIQLEEPVEIPPTVEDFVRINAVELDDLTILLDITYVDSFYDIVEETLQRPIRIEWGDGSSLNENVTVNTAPNTVIFPKTYDTYGTYTINITAIESNQITSVEIPLIEPIEEEIEIPVPIEFEGDWIQGGDFNYIANTLPPTADVLLCTDVDFTTGLYPDSDCVGQVEGAGCFDSGLGFDYGECRPYPSARTIKNSIFETCESTEPITDEALLESYLEGSLLRTIQYQEDGTAYQTGNFSYTGGGYGHKYLDSGKGYIFQTQSGVNFCLKLTQPEPNL